MLTFEFLNMDNIFTVLLLWRAQQEYYYLAPMRNKWYFDSYQLTSNILFNLIKCVNGIYYFTSVPCCYLIFPLFIYFVCFLFAYFNTSLNMCVFPIISSLLILLINKSNLFIFLVKLFVIYLSKDSNNFYFANLADRWVFFFKYLTTDANRNW